MIVVVHRTTCTNVDSIQCTNYDDMQQSKSMHKLWYTMQQSTISFAGIFRPYHSSCFCQSVTIVIIILNVQQYNCRRTTCTNVDSIQASWQDDNNQNQCTTYDYATQQSTIHFAAICQPYHSRRRRIECTTIQLPCWGWLVDCLFLFR